MAKPKTYKCAFKHCKHQSQVLQENEAVKVGNRYMHEDCARTSENMIKVRDVYYERISQEVVMKILVRVIQNIVLEKGIDAEYLVFAIEYAADNKIPIRSPYGLYYLVDNYKVKEAWKNKNIEKRVSEIKKEAEQNVIIDPQANKFNFKQTFTGGFGSIFGG